MPTRPESPDQRSPEPESSTAWQIDERSGKAYGHERPRPPTLVGTWAQRNFTLGNLIMIVTMLLAAGAWMRSTETQDIALKDRVHQAEARVERLEADTMTKELFGARLDAIAERLKAIEDRLTRIERMKQ